MGNGVNDELIRKKDALDALMAERKHLLANGQKGAEHVLTHHGYNVIDELKPVQSDVPDMNVGDMISRQDAIDAICIDCCGGNHDHDCRFYPDCDNLKSIKAIPPVQPTITHEQAIDYLHETGWLQNHDRILTESKIVPPVQPKNGTLIIPLNESDFKSVKRIMLDNKPWCRTFYEEGGEAHWIKSYTPDDGEIYECDNCGVVWQFNDGGPEENEAFFCPKCGFKMERGEAG